MSRSKNLGYTCRCTFRFLVHRKFIGEYGLIFMHSALYVPTSKVATISAGEGACSEASNRRPLPEAIIDVPSIQSRFFGAGICEREAKRAFPCGFWDLICTPGWRGSQ